MLFYVYEHWRPDTDVCFYVGKGTGRRAWGFRRRNPYYRNIVAKLSRLGLCVEVRLVRGSLVEEQALSVEKERIAFWRSAGVKIANVTDGGEGVSGLRHTEATRQKMKEKRAGQSREKHRAVMTGRSLPAEHREKISAANKGRQVSAETRERISKALKGRAFSTQRIERLRISHIGNTPTEETRRKMSDAQRRRHAREREKV